MSSKFFSFSLFFFLIISLFSVCVVGFASADAYHQIVFAEGVGGSIRISFVGVTYGAGTYVFADGASLIISAFADAGYSFKNFTFTGGSTEVNPIYTYAYSNFTITAYFESGVQSTYTVEMRESVGGSVFLNGMDGVESWVGVGRVEVHADANMSFSVVTYVNYEFVGVNVYNWYGVLLAQYNYNPVNITVDQDMIIEGVFSFNGVTPSPDPNDGVISGIMGSTFGKIILVLLIVFVPPMMVLVGAPKIGYMGFFIILLLMVLVGVQFGILESWYLIVMVLGFGLMFFSAIKQVV